jgi:hypothetical protein
LGKYKQEGSPIEFNLGRTAAQKFEGFDVTSRALQSSTLPSSTIPIIYDNSTADVVLAVDPEKKMIFCGESQLFTDITANFNSFSHEIDKIGVQLIAFVRECAAYGDAFSTMLIDGAAVAEPWDDVWGANKYQPTLPTNTSYWPLN